jgi:hypothetical protein
MLYTEERICDCYEYIDDAVACFISGLRVVVHLVAHFLPYR